MNYSRIYKKLMDRAKGRTHDKHIHERHHIEPRSLGGQDAADNLVSLTYREHFLAHWILMKITKGEDRRKMSYAMQQLTRKTNRHALRIISGWQYELAKRALMQTMLGRTGSKAPMYGRTGDKNPRARRVMCLEDSKEFSTIREAAEFYNINSGDISSVCRGSLRHVGGLHFKYVDNK